jgi:hypothetical protein
VKKVQQFSDGMKIMLDIEDDAVYVNMTGQSPSFLFFHPSQKIIFQSLKGYLPDEKIPPNVVGRNRLVS